MKVCETVAAHLNAARRPRRQTLPWPSMAHATRAKQSATERRAAAVERTSGMFAHLAPGVSLADELVADRRAEVRAEERADEAERGRRGRG